MPPSPISGGVRIYAEVPPQGGESRRGELERIARPGWLAALPSPPEGGEEDEDEAGRMADRRGAALLLFAGRSVARWWRGGGNVWRWLRPEADEAAALPLVLVAGAMVAKR